MSDPHEFVRELFTELDNNFQIFEEYFLSCFCAVYSVTDIDTFIISFINMLFTTLI